MVSCQIEDPRGSNPPFGQIQLEELTPHWYVILHLFMSQHKHHAECSVEVVFYAQLCSDFFDHTFSQQISMRTNDYSVSFYFSLILV